MNFQEAFAVIFSLLCVILTIRRSVWCWATGIVGIAFYAYVFYYQQLYADMALQAVFLVQSVYGWLLWLRNGGEIDDTQKVVIQRLNTKVLLLHFVVAFVMWIIVSKFLLMFTDSSVPVIDALLSVASLVANYYLAKRIVESWFIWILTDASYVVLFAYKEMYLSASLYGLFFFMAIYGLLEWKKTLNTKTAFS